MAVTLTVQEAAARLGLSERTVWRRIRSGQLAVDRSGHAVRVSVPPDASWHRIGEAPASYAPAFDPVTPQLAAPGPWPFTQVNLEREAERRRATRMAALVELGRIAAHTLPDPDGRTSLDDLRPVRDPGWDAGEDR